MNLRISGHAQAKALLGSDKAHQFIGMTETVRMGDKIGLSLWRVSPQGHDVLNPCSFKLLQNGEDFFSAVSHTGEVGHGLNSGLSLDTFGKLDGLSARAPSGPIGDGYKCGVEFFQVCDRLEERIVSRIVFGREKLKGENRLTAAKVIFDLHGIKPRGHQEDIHQGALLSIYERLYCQECGLRGSRGGLLQNRETSESKRSHSEREYHHEEHEGHKVKLDCEILRDLRVLRGRQVSCYKSRVSR